MDGTNGPKESTRATASVASNALSVGQPVPNDTKVIARYLVPLPSRTASGSFPQRLPRKRHGWDF